MLVSKSPVVSWWDAGPLQEVSVWPGDRIRTKASLERWSAEGISEITWEEAIWVFQSRGLLWLACTNAEDTRKISFFTARLASFSITQDDAFKLFVASMKLSEGLQSSRPVLKERHIDLPYKHWNMRSFAYVAFRELVLVSPAGHVMISPWS